MDEFNPVSESIKNAVILRGKEMPIGGGIQLSQAMTVAIYLIREIILEAESVEDFDVIRKLEWKEDHDRGVGYYECQVLRHPRFYAKQHAMDKKPVPA